MPRQEPSPLKDAIMDAVYVPLERDDMQTPCTLPFMTSSEHGVCDGDGCPVSDETIAGALNAVAKIQTEYYKVKKEAQKGTKKGMTNEPRPRPWRVADIAHDYDILDADGKVAARAAHGNRELAAFIVAAVNKHGMPIVELIKGYDALEAERERLRDALNEVCRRASVALNCPRDETEEVELLVHDLLGIKECARAAIGEDKP